MHLEARMENKSAVQPRRLRGRLSTPMRLSKKESGYQRAEGNLIVAGLGARIPVVPLGGASLRLSTALTLGPLSNFFSFLFVRGNTLMRDK
jgi:hypothetical protein